MCVPSGGIGGGPTVGGPAIGSPVTAGPGPGFSAVQPTPLIQLTAGPASFRVERNRSALWLAVALAAVVVLAGRK